MISPFQGSKQPFYAPPKPKPVNEYDFPSAKLPKVLKTAQKANLAASFQKTAVETLVHHLKIAEEEFKPKSVVIAGGVAVNQLLRQEASKQLKTRVTYPPIELCTDNAAMVAALGYFQASNKRPPVDPYTLEPDPGLKM